MVHVLIEENYSSNNRIKTIFDGMNSVLKKKRLSLEVFKSLDEIKDRPRVVILICASLKWTMDAIKALNARGIHPLVFGFQYLDTVYQYSCITLLTQKPLICLRGICFPKTPVKPRLSAIIPTACLTDLNLREQNMQPSITAFP